MRGNIQRVCQGAQMRQWCCFTMVAIFVLSGCTGSKSQGNNCVKPVFSKIIVNVSAKNIEIPENKYAYLKEPMLNITSDSLVSTIKEEFNDIPKKVIIEKDRKCSNGAILVDGQLMSLTHRSKRFSGDMNLKVINCSNNDVILSDEFSARNKDRDFPDTPTELGTNAGKAVVESLTGCVRAEP